MKHKLAALRDRINAISVRERVMMFCAIVGTVVFLLYSFSLAPLNARRAAALAQIAQQQNNITGIDAEISATVQAYAIDPDKAAREHLAALKSEAATLSGDLRAMQNGLVAPERVAPMLESMLRSNGRLQLVGMKTLPMTTIQGAASAPAPAPVAGQPPAAALPNALPVLYKHGVELTVRGSYLDMIGYMDALAHMPNRLFWGQANLQVEQYPNARLTLTLYTLSLDQKWMKL